MIKMYWGAASGSARKALRQLEKPKVMISFATQNNTPWDGIEELFIDCGGYSMMINGKGHPPAEEYAQYLRDVNPDYYALPDCPCEPDLLQEKDASVEEHQEETLERHLEMIEMDVPGEAVAVVQGWNVHEYLEFCDRLQDHGLITDRVGIGSVCRRHSEREIEQVVTAIREELGPSVELHGFGVKTSILKRPKCLDALDTCDTDSYEFRHFKRDDRGRIPQYLQYAYHYLDMKMEVAEINDTDDAQQTLYEV